MLQLVKGSGKKAGKCQSHANFFPEGLTNVCGHSKGTERNLKLIGALFHWEVSPDQNTLRTLPIRGGGLKKFQVSLSSLAAHR